MRDAILSSPLRGDMGSARWTWNGQGGLDCTGARMNTAVEALGGGMVLLHAFLAALQDTLRQAVSIPV